MSPRKLTEADKEELLVAYRETSETTSTLADRYGVSSSTISRFLKSCLQGGEYEDLIQRKRLGRSNSVKKAEKSVSEGMDEVLDAGTQDAPLLRGLVDNIENFGSVAIEEVENTGSRQEDLVELDSSAGRRSRSRRSRPQLKESKGEVLPLLQEIPADFSDVEEGQMPDVEAEEFVAEFDDRVEEINSDLLALAQEISLGDRQSALQEFLGDDIGEEDDDEDDEEDDEDDEEDEVAPSKYRSEETEAVQILPIAEAHFPRTCYIVTDKMSELIARPMREFRDLGHIPDNETTQKTLPIFDNHRVAKRFIHGRSQKVIKVPDSSLFAKASTCLTSKGITRILLNGKIYNLP